MAKLATDLPTATYLSPNYFLVKARKEIMSAALLILSPLGFTFNAAGGLHGLRAPLRPPP